MPSIFIALGSNIDPEENLKAAVTMLRDKHPAIRFSSVYRSAPLHHEDQEDFLNAVAALDADQSPEEIYEFLTHIERHLGKNPPFKFGPRTIDLDLLLHGDAIIPDSKSWKMFAQPDARNPQLVIPHPRMHERRFVLEPLTELIHPESKHPVLGRTWKELLSETEWQNLQRMRIQL